MLLQHNSLCVINPSGLQQDAQLKFWRDLYRDIFEIALDERVRWPRKISGFNRGLIIAKGITAQKVLDACKTLFVCQTDVPNLDVDIRKNERHANDQSYAIWVRNESEAQHRRGPFEKDGLHWITLTERLLFELAYFIKTGKHLDCEQLTICEGSIDSSGHEPCVFSRTGDMRIQWGAPLYHLRNARSRRVIA